MLNSVQHSLEKYDQETQQGKNDAQTIVDDLIISFLISTLSEIELGE